MKLAGLVVGLLMIATSLCVAEAKPFGQENGAIVNMIANGNQLVTVIKVTDTDLQMNFWSVDGKKQLSVPLQLHKVYDLTFANDNVVCGGEMDNHGEILTINSHTGQTGGIPTPTLPISLSANGDRIAYGCSHQAVLLTNNAVTNELATEGEYTHVAFSPDGKSLLVGAADKAVIWDLGRNETQELRNIKHNGTVALVAWQTVPFVALTHNDSIVMIWQEGNTSHLRGLGRLYKEACFALSPDGMYMAHNLALINRKIILVQLLDRPGGYSLRPATVVTSLAWGNDTTIYSATGSVIERWSPQDQA